MSCYALFKGWLLLSQPPGCFSDPTSLHTKPALGGLSRWSGLFPSRQRSLSPAVSLLECELEAFVVWLGLVSSRPLAHPVPYLLKSSPRLHLNAFRGEPAISEFVWHFTSTHSSSRVFVTTMGSSLHPDIIEASLWPWVAHPVSGLLDATIALFGLAFATAPPLSGLTLLRLSNSPVHSSIGTPSSRFASGLRRFVGSRFQVYFTPLPGCFSPFPHGTSSLSVAKGI